VLGTAGTSSWRQPVAKPPSDVELGGVQREIEVGLARRLRRELQVEPLIILPWFKRHRPATPAYKAVPMRPQPPAGRVGRQVRFGEASREIIRNVGSRHAKPDSGWRGRQGRGHLAGPAAVPAIPQLGCSRDPVVKAAPAGLCAS